MTYDVAKRKLTYVNQWSCLHIRLYQNLKRVNVRSKTQSFKSFVKRRENFLIIVYIIFFLTRFTAFRFLSVSLRWFIFVPSFFLCSGPHAFCFVSQLWATLFFPWRSMPLLIFSCLSSSRKFFTYFCFRLKKVNTKAYRSVPLENGKTDEKRRRKKEEESLFIRDFLSFLFTSSRSVRSLRGEIFSFFVALSLVLHHSHVLRNVEKERYLFIDSEVFK